MARKNETRISKYWPLIIIVVVLSFMIFALNRGTGVGTSNPGLQCHFAPHYFCWTVDLSRNGILSIPLFQNIGYNAYNVKMACYITAGGNNSYSPIPYFALNALGSANDTLSEDEIVNITDLPCYYTNGSKVGPIKTDIQMNGSIWINYTTSNTTSNFTVANEIISKVANFTVKTT